MTLSTESASPVVDADVFADDEAELPSPQSQPEFQAPKINPEVDTEKEVDAGKEANSDVPGAEAFEEFRNTNPNFTRYADLSASEISLNTPGLMEPSERPDNGASSGEGQFRINCNFSHYSYDDPIIYPGKPGAAHLHMFLATRKPMPFQL